MNPWTREPYFVLKSNGRVVKLYENNDSISPFYRFYPKDEQSLENRKHSSSKLVGEFKHDQVDEIRLQEHPVKIYLKNLPPDVVLAEYGKDDDAGTGRIRDEKDFMKRHHKLAEEVEE